MASSLAKTLANTVTHEKQSPGRAALPPHVIVQALAGTGKTTTIVEGLKFMQGLPPAITPSAQQQAIWDQMRLSAGARSICA